MSFVMASIFLASVASKPAPPPAAWRPEVGKFVCEVEDGNGRRGEIVGTLGYFEVYGDAVPQAKVSLKSEVFSALDGDYSADWNARGTGDLTKLSDRWAAPIALRAIRWISRHGAMVIAAAIKPDGSANGVIVAGHCNFDFELRG